MKQNYEQAYYILESFFEYIPEELKKQVDAELKECGL